MVPNGVADLVYSFAGIESPAATVVPAAKRRARRRKHEAPAWAAEYLDEQGLHFAGLVLHVVRGMPLGRGNKVSTEDIHTALIACCLVLGRGDLLRKLP